MKNIGSRARNAKKAILLSAAAKKAAYFFGCDQYPGCDYVSWDRPSGKPCPQCEGMLVIKRNKSGARIHCTIMRLQRMRRITTGLEEPIDDQKRKDVCECFPLPWLEIDCHYESKEEYVVNLFL